MKLLNVASVIFCLIGFKFTVQAQNAIPASGGNATGSGTVSYTAGQVVYTTNTSSNGSVAQGVQQPFEISVITGIELAKEITLVCSVYPNPATEFVKLKIKNYEVKNLRYQLYDINSSLLQDNKIVDEETEIIMSNLLPATYFLKVTDNNIAIKTFKIIKTR
ncbi:MAG: T9SS type A sorting domain-containing protein [Bacteroidales bacterium]|jgi:hypothetical protein|nr:T9SS type A sorting domain-containing protein [Bacteroidales bacterium]